MNIPQLPADKAGHLIAGLVVFCIFGLFSPIIGLCAAIVTDAMVPVALATVVGGGSVVAPVFFNGTNWIVG